MSEHSKGLIFGIIAFCIWGLVPIYWKPLDHVDAYELMFYRVFWLLVFNAFFVVILKKRREFFKIFSNQRLMKRLTLTGAFIGVNWLIFIWGVNNDQVKEVSLGYFINPLLNVALGALLLKERLKPIVWGCVGLAFLGVSYLAFSEGVIPTVSIVLALTFGFYGLLKKSTDLDPMLSLTFEAFVIFIIMTIGMLMFDHVRIEQVTSMHWGWMVYMSMAGLITLAPLYFFNKSAQRIPLSTLGFIQYIAPTLQFLVAIFYLKENLNENYLMAFSLIWLALVIFSVETWRGRKRNESK